MKKIKILKWDYEKFPVSHQLPNIIDIKLTDKTRLVFADYDKKVFKLLIWEPRSVNSNGKDRKGLYCAHVVTGYIPGSLEKIRTQAHDLMIKKLLELCQKKEKTIANAAMKRS